MALKLSEAIREGAKLRPMATEEYFGFDFKAGRYVCVSSCALGAAFEAMAGKTPAGPAYDPAWIEEELERKFPELFESFVIDTILVDAITHKNDSGKFTREEIADWLESCGL